MSSLEKLDAQLVGIGQMIKATRFSVPNYQRPYSWTDIEVDEVSMVISGRARIDFVAPPLPSIELGPGDVFRLEAGMKTVWTVTETLRKVYVA